MNILYVERFVAYHLATLGAVVYTKWAENDIVSRTMNSIKKIVTEFPTVDPQVVIS